MSSRIENLMFTVGLIDKASGPAGRITQQMDSMVKTATGGLARIAGGGAGLWAAAAGLQRLIAPSVELNRAMGEVRSLDVADNAMQALQKSALAFSVQYGESATDFVRSSYDIQSAIGGLVGNELAQFTHASNVLAKGTKADAATITNYMGTMYGIFTRDAQQMGKAEWVQQLTGQTAMAVQMFKTNGTEMSAAFSNLGANAQAFGVDMQEQMAVLGQLQSTMSGSQAGTRYRAFLAGVGQAQKKLGLQFTDSNGKLLPMVQILDRINQKFGHLGDVARGDILKQAFGSGEAVSLLNQLLPGSAQLADNIQRIASINGMDNAAKMAQEMADPYERMAALSTALKIGLGNLIQPVLIPLIDVLMKAGTGLMNFAEAHPLLHKGLAMVLLAVIGVTAAISAFAVAAGIAKLATVAWGTAAISAFAVAAGIAKLATVAWGTAQIALAGIMAVLKGGLALLTLKVWLFNVGLVAVTLPIWAIVAVIALLVAGVVLLYQHWSELVAWFSDIGWVKGLVAALGWVGDKFAAISQLIAGRSEISAKITTEDAAARAAAPALSAPAQVSAQLGAGGLQRDFVTMNNQRGHHIENMNITTQKVDAAQLSDELAMMG